MMAVSLHLLFVYAWLSYFSTHQLVWARQALGSAPASLLQRSSAALGILRGGNDARHNYDTDDISRQQSLEGFKILSETVLHDNWRKLVSRRVELPSGHKADFEIVSQGDRGGRVSDQAVLVFCWNRQTQTATLIREYMPAVHKLVMGLAAGMVEDKHNDTEDGEGSNPIFTAAVHELEEECRLTGGTWYRLCQPTVMDKYCTTLLSVYLVIDPVPVDESAIKPRDETEEGMEVVVGTTVAELREMIATARMTVVGGWATQMALTKLRDLGEIQE